MIEGDLVVVAGKIDERVRPHDGGLVIGTLVKIDHTDQVWVLLSTLDFWVGSKREVFLQKDQD